MKQSFFPLLITLLVFIAAYMFYALWHMDEEDIHGSMHEIAEEKQGESFSPEEVKFKKVFHSDDQVKRTPVDNHPLNSENMTETEVLKEKGVEENIEETYDAMIPFEHEDTMQVATETFDEIDMFLVETIEPELSEQMESAEPPPMTETEVEEDDEATDVQDTIDETEFQEGEEITTEDEDIDNL